MGHGVAYLCIRYSFGPNTPFGEEFGLSLFFDARQALEKPAGIADISFLFPITTSIVVLSTVPSRRASQSRRAADKQRTAYRVSINVLDRTGMALRLSFTRSSECGAASPPLGRALI